MASFSQWLRNRAVRRFMWVCGPEQVLASDVVAEAVRSAGDVFFLQAGADAERDIWALAAQAPPLDAGPRLLVIREAQKLGRWDQLGALAASRELSEQRLLFLSPEPDFTHHARCGCRSCGGQEASRELASHLALIRDSRSGLLVRCLAPGDESPDWLLDWLSARMPGGSRVLADRLLVCTGGSLAAAVQVAAKLEAAGLQTSTERLQALAESVPGDSFADALVLRGKRQALEAAALVSLPETGAVIGALDWRLDTLSSLQQARSRGLDSRDTSMRLGVSQFLQRKYGDAAGAYPRSRVTSCRAVLAAADDAWRRGADCGVLEMITALW